MSTLSGSCPDHFTLSLSTNFPGVLTLKVQGLQARFGIRVNLRIHAFSRNASNSRHRKAPPPPGDFCIIFFLNSCEKQVLMLSVRRPSAAPGTEPVLLLTSPRKQC